MLFHDTREYSQKRESFVASSFLPLEHSISRIRTVHSLRNIKFIWSFTKNRNHKITINIYKLLIYFVNTYICSSGGIQT